MVEWKKLGDVCSLKARIGWQGLTQKEHKKTGDFLLVTGTDFKSNYQVDFDHCVYVDEIRYTQDPNIQLRPNDVLITKDGTLGKMAVIEDLPKPATLNGGLFVIRDTTGRIHHKFLLHYMLSSKFQSIIESNHTNGTIKHLTQGLLTNFPFPIPSLQEQNRIVGILDTFTSSIENLKQQIAERRKQYEYYRDQLLDLEGKEGVEMITLGEIGDVCMCKRIMKDQTTDKGDVPFFKIGTFGGKADAYITRELFEEYKSKFSYPIKGEILLSASGTIGRTVVYNGEDAYFQDSNIVWIANNEKLVTNEYLYYIYSTIDWKVDGGTIKRLYNYNLKSTIIPVPSVSEQSRIVSILDTFEASIANLEAQLSQREQQYEYYRNKLLTFE